MESVRNSERKLRSELPIKKAKLSNECHELDVTTKIKPSADEDRLGIEEVDLHDTMPVQFDEIDDFAEPFVEDEEILAEPLIEEPKFNLKIESAKNTFSPLPKEPCVTFLDYVLEHKVEHGQKYVSVRVDRKSVKSNESYEFNVISHSDAETIYSCKNCVKAFGSLELLMKHITMCHLCMICFRNLSSYNDLNDHMKKDHQDKLICPFPSCKKPFNIKSLRKHIKTTHVPNLPNYYSVLVE